MKNRRRTGGKKQFSPHFADRTTAQIAGHDLPFFLTRPSAEHRSEHLELDGRDGDVQHHPAELQRGGSGIKYWSTECPDVICISPVTDEKQRKKIEISQGGEYEH